MRNDFKVIDDDTILIYLKSSFGTKECIIDRKGFDILKETRRTPMAKRARERESFYAIIPQFRGKRSFLLHRLFMDAPDDKMVDHINHDTLDNRFCNLRLVTNSENQYNRKGLCSNNRSGYNNISWVGADKSWRASLLLSGKKVCIGQNRDLQKVVRMLEDFKSIHGITR